MQFLRDSGNVLYELEPHLCRVMMIRDSGSFGFWKCYQDSEDIDQILRPNRPDTNSWTFNSTP